MIAVHEIQKENVTTSQRSTLKMTVTLAWREKSKTMLEVYYQEE